MLYEVITGYATIPLNGIETLWEGGRELAARAAGDRSIFTYIDKNKDEAVNSGELVSFNLDNSEAIMPYLSVQLSAPEINEDVITSYSIHYTKLYDGEDHHLLS